MKEEIKKIIEKAIKDLAKDAPDFSIEISDDKNHGDYSTNVALVLAKKIRKKSKRNCRRYKRIKLKIRFI